jgi:hypothetical protein
MVDGASSYTEMLSYHAFDLLGEYPKSEQKEGYHTGITYSDVYFLEPETRSDQSRLVSIIKTDKTSGYYVDIFRSRKQKGGDKFHDYFYHNLGQTMEISDANNIPLELNKNEEMGFAGGHLYAFDYMWDKNSIRISEDYQVEWKIDMPEGEDDIFMNLWMKGTEGREVFSIKSPPCKSFKKGGGLPYDVNKKPYLTFAARQHGEAWEHPFVSVYEPFTSSEGKSISSISSFEDENNNPEFVGLNIKHKSGREDLVFSSKKGRLSNYNDISIEAIYGLVANEKNGDFTLFIGNGKYLEANGYIISAIETGKIVFEKKNDKLFLNSDVIVTVYFNNKENQFDIGDLREIKIN